MGDTGQAREWLARTTWLAVLTGAGFRPKAGRRLYVGYDSAGFPTPRMFPPLAPEG